MKQRRKTISDSIRRKKRKAEGYLGFLLIFALILAADQASKAAMRSNFFPGSSKTIIPGLLYLTYAQNTGVSFGLFAGYNLIFIVVLLAAFFFFAALFRKKENYRPQITVICAGISGNLIDRLFFGFVTDFIDIKIWPIFNLADSSISIGILWLIIAMAINKDEIF